MSDKKPFNSFGFLPQSSQSVWAVFLIALFVQPAFGRIDQTIEARWPDLTWIEGEKVHVIATDGTVAKGRVIAVRTDGILLEKRDQEISQARVAEIRVIQYRGSGRRWGKRVGGACGLLAGLVGAVAIGLDEASQHKSRDKAVATSLVVGGLPIGLTVGYLVGKQTDKFVTAIRVIRD